MQKLLLISNSTIPGQPYLEYAKQHIDSFLGEVKDDIVFIPYAAVTFSYDEYVTKVNNSLLDLGIKVRGLHTYNQPLKAISEAKAIVVGGGNTFKLLKTLQNMGALSVMRERVESGTPYIGWSAGSNLSCPTINTTNDMPIVMPESFNALNLIDFQINPHYLDVHPEGHGGETREQRIAEYLVANPTRMVVGLREGSILKVEGESMELLGSKSARVFRYNHEVVEVPVGTFKSPF